MDLLADGPGVRNAANTVEEWHHKYDVSFSVTATRYKPHCIANLAETRRNCPVDFRRAQ